MLRTTLLTALVLAACGDPAPSGFSTGPGVTTAPATTGGSSTGGSGSTSTGTAEDSAGTSSAEGSTTLLRDVGTDQDFGPAQPAGCKGKVDLLFLISRQQTMKNQQTQLLASFPGFVATIQAKLVDFDVHIMVANPDGKWAGWGCEQFGCPDHAPNCGPDAPGYQCYIFPKLITPCDSAMGAGLTFNAGDGAANRQCDLYGGNRYIVSFEPDMADALECIAKVGWNGGDPPMGDALIAALAPKINAEGGCNAGFLRNDALLVVVIVNDTYDTESKSWPYQQYKAVVDAKGGDPNAIVVLGVLPPPLEEGVTEDPNCGYDVLPAANKMRQLVEMFPNYVAGDVCAADYAPFFDQAANLIDEACGKFVPQ